MKVGGGGGCGVDEGSECEDAEETKLENLFSPYRKPEKTLKDETRRRPMGFKPGKVTVNMPLNSFEGGEFKKKESDPANLHKMMISLKESFEEEPRNQRDSRLLRGIMVGR
jgi:hypothetical protein